MSKISFISDGYRLAGNLFVASEPKKLAFLMIQGWTGHQNIEAAQALADAGFTTMTYDMRGNGESEGDLAEFSRADFVKDAGVAYDYLKEKVGADTKIGVTGSSFGSYTAVLLSKDRSVYCLSLRVPAPYPDEGYDEPQLPQANSYDSNEWRNQEVNYTQNKAFNALHDFAGPVQIIQAEADELVPDQSVKNYANAVADQSKLTYEVVPGAPHRLANDKLQADYQKRLLAWVEMVAEEV